MKIHLKLSDPHPSRMPSVTGNVNHFKHFLFAFASRLKERGRNVPLMVGGDGVGGWGESRHVCFWGTGRACWVPSGPQTAATPPRTPTEGGQGLRVGVSRIPNSPVLLINEKAVPFQPPAGEGEAEAPACNVCGAETCLCECFLPGIKRGGKRFFSPQTNQTLQLRNTRNVYNLVLQKSILKFFKALSLIKSRQRITFSPILLHLTWTHTG